MKNIAVLAGLVLAVGFVAWLGGCIPGPAGQPAVDTAPTTTTATEPAVPIKVKINNFAFIPAELEIPSGTMVIFTNFDTAPHQIAFVGGLVGDSSVMAYNESFSYTFSQTGSFQYYCKIHPSMKGKIIVK